jgi:hypothetical protein
MRLKANKTSQIIPQQTSQKIKPLPKVEEVEETPEEVEEEEEEETNEEEVTDDDEEPNEEELTGKELKKPKIDPQKQIEMEIELLHNNGRFRVELLHQLIEINRALRVVAGVLVELTSDGKETETQK